MFGLMAIYILLLLGLLAGFLVYKNMIDQERTHLNLKLKNEERMAKSLLEELTDLSEREEDIRQRELATLNLYLVTKKMSESLAFGEIFKVFSAFLKENFVFKKCDLIMLNWDDPVTKIGNVYSVSHGFAGAPAAEAGESIDYDRLMNLLLKKPERIQISQGDGEIAAFTAIPLLSEKKLVAILAVECLPKNDVEKFNILAMQFALEIEKVLLYETVERLAITDSLTGLYARRYFFERMNEEAQRSKRYKFKFAFLMCDIDDFKQCNDTYGHLVGDVILREIGRIMKESVREIDFVSRYGGEEFALMLPETGEDGARLVAERIRKKIEESIFRAYDEKLKVTISIGIAIYPKDALKMKDLTEKADRALYAAKKSGKNVVCGYKK